MPLFQPTNITPSTFGGVGNGTVDITLPLTVSWQVNGNTAMTAFSITIYNNDSQSTQVYTTGQLTENCPFYGVSYPFSQANTFFSYTIPEEDLSSAGMTNGSEYKLIIQQWWGNGEGDSVTQTSASAFITRQTPTVAVDAFSTPITSKSYTFTATYTQAQGDPLLWARWQIAPANEPDMPLLDTNNIYNATELTISYDGFFTDTTYVVKCTVETVNGQQADSGWQLFQVSYAAESYDGFINVCCLKNTSGTLVEWTRFAYIEGEATGEYTADQYNLSLPKGSSIYWNEESGNPLVIASPWSVMWQGKATAVGTILELETSSGSPVELQIGANYIALTYADQILYQGTLPDPYRANIRVILQSNRIDIRAASPGNGLYPSETLYPSDTLYPIDETQSAEVVNLTGQFENITASITGVRLLGPQTCNYLVINEGYTQASQVSSAMYSEEYIPVASWDTNTRFYADFSNDLSAGNNPPLGIEVTGFSIYRLTSGEQAITKLYDAPLSQREFIDYGAASQTTYTYYVFANDGETYVLNPFISAPFTPVFWDWAILECEADSNGVYHVLNQYLFGKNLVSGAISNNNTPTTYQNFTPYPLVQPTTPCYASGTLSSYIGTVSVGKYSDTIAMRNAIFQLSTTQNTLFLKSRKGDIWQIKIAGPITATTWDQSVEQAQNLSVPWVEVAEANNMAIIATPLDEIWPS